MKFIKKNAKYIGIVMVCVFCSYLTTIATSYIFESSDVRFDNTGTSLESVNVQDAIDETFHHVTDYNEIKTTIGNSTLTTTNQTLTGGINEVNSKMPTGNVFDEILIPAGSNLNDYRTAGTFIVPYDSTADQISNMPRRASGRLIVMNRTTSSYMVQEYYPTTADPIKYVRNYNNGTWTNWDQITLNSKLQPEYFNITFVSAITDITIRAAYGYYIEATNTVHINIVITSNSGLIPVANNEIGSVPLKYAPKISRDIGMAFVIPLSQNSWQPMSAESCRVESSGKIMLGNYIYGNKPTKFFSITSDYTL